MTDRTVYVGEAVTMEQVVAAVKAWQDASGDKSNVSFDEDGDGYPGMGFAIDLYGTDAEPAARRLAAGIKPLLEGIPVMTVA